MSKLEIFIGNRDNNFNLIRFFSALMVLYSHSFALAIGSSSAEPWSILGITPGSVAVDIFFVTSGFLVAGSLFERRNLKQFVVSRVLRIYPALLVMVALTIFGLGAYFSTLNLLDYFSEIELLKYGIKNSTLFGGTYYHLPHVFEDNPYKRAVNGSLWTMPWEVRMYVLLLGVGFLAQMTKWRIVLWRFIVVAITVCLFSFYITHYYLINESPIFEERTFRLFVMFFMGVAFYALKDKIYISFYASFLAVLCILISYIVEKRLLLPVYTIFIGFIILNLAYLPSLRVKFFNQLGDYSYGIYICFSNSTICCCAEPRHIWY